MKYLKMSILLLILLLGISAISAHGVDVTADTMVIANDSNEKMVKSIADSNNINISVYKFTSEDEVTHILEHSIDDTNKRILFTAYQETANDFLKKHPDMSNRIIVIDNVNNNTTLEGLQNIMNAPVENTDSENNFGLPLASGIIIGLLVGIGFGAYIMKR